MKKRIYDSVGCGSKLECTFPEEKGGMVKCQCGLNTAFERKLSAEEIKRNKRKMKRECHCHL